MRSRIWLIIASSTLLFAAVLNCGCAERMVTASPTQSAIIQDIPGLTSNQVTSLANLIKVDDHPLYTLTLSGSHTAKTVDQENMAFNGEQVGSWACSLFAALGDADAFLYGRNFDWEHSPVLLLFTDPPDGYASASLVNLAYLVHPDKVDHLTEIPVEDRTELLEAPLWPFDGMNEAGLTIGMAAVPDSETPILPDLDAIGSLGVIREVLDHTKTVTEATQLMAQYNIIMDGGPHLHYLIADATGQAVLVELFEGSIHNIPNTLTWHAATNFTASAVHSSTDGKCWRYDTIAEQMIENEGTLSIKQALSLLSAVSQPNTQWSVVYDMSAQNIHIALARNYEVIHSFSMPD